MTEDGETLRDRQLMATRAAIIEAFLDLAHAENAVSISMPAVAKGAGVSVRTVYRHFPTKDDLQTAASLHYSSQARGGEESEAGAIGDARLYLTNLWTNLATEIPAVLAEHTSPAGRSLRATRLPVARQIIDESAGPGRLRAETIDLMIALSSSSMFLELVDRMGHDPRWAAAQITNLLDQIVEAELNGRPLTDGLPADPDQTDS